MQKKKLPLGLKIKKKFSKFGQFCSDLMFPDNIKCMFCENDIPDFENVPYCKECEKELPFNNSHRCEICDQPIFDEATTCDFCQKEKRNFDKVFCPFLYEGKVKNAILAFKDSNQKFRAKAFANLIVRRMGETAKTIDFVTYIPMTPKKEKRRGFNQSQLLAEEIGKILKVSVLSVFEKLKESENQKELSYKQRRANMVGMFALKKVKLSKSDNVLLVDDVVTTCATIGYCSGLLRPKVSKIFVGAIAREYVRPQKPDSEVFKKKKY